MEPRRFASDQPSYRSITLIRRGTLLEERGIGAELARIGEKRLTGKPLFTNIELLAENAPRTGREPAELAIDSLSRCSIDALLGHHGVHLHTMVGNPLRVAMVVHSVAPPEHAKHRLSGSTSRLTTM